MRGLIPGLLTKNDGGYLPHPSVKESQPRVSIVIPMLNEAEAIARCVRSILDQSYPVELIEIIVVDGMSRDGSRDRVAELAKEHANIKLYDNPQRRTPIALNIGARNAQGNVVIILGAHTQIHRDFVRLNIQYMNELDVKCVGGTQLNVGETFLQRAIGLAMGSFFGIPSAPYRFLPKKRFVDTVVYASYRKELFEEIGYFDEELHISEDAEFNWRIRKAGYRIFYTPEIISYYYPRKTLGRLFKQFFNYGILRVNVIKKHQDAVKAIHLLPPLFILAIIILALASFHLPVFRLLLGILAVLYALYICWGSIYTSVKNKTGKYLFVLPLVFLTMHISWGLGFWTGLAKTYR